MESVMTALCLTEREALAECEAVIDRGRRVFVEVGQALQRIRDGRLYRATHSAFEDYCEERWGFSRNYADRLVGAAEVVRNLMPIGITPPATESQARPLTRLDPEQQAEAWQRAVDSAPEGRVTARHVEAIVDTYREPEAQAEYLPDLDAYAPVIQKAVPAAPLEPKPRDGDEWYTPERFARSARAVLGTIDLDPASCEAANQTIGAVRYYDQEADGLAQYWEAETAWLNPPYSNAGDWVERLVDAYEQGQVKQAILLVNANTSSAWFAPLWDHVLCFVAGRVSFVAGDGGKSQTGWSPSVIVYLGHDPLKFYREFAQYGAMVSRMKEPLW